jgi:hypothetical protein
VGNGLPCRVPRTKRARVERVYASLFFFRIEYECTWARVVSSLDSGYCLFGLGRATRLPPGPWVKKNAYFL